MIMRAKARAIMAGLSLLLLSASQSSRINASLPHQPEYLEGADRAGLRFHFRNSPTSRKYLIEAMGGGVAIFDYDNDGWQDIFLVNGAALKDPETDGAAPDKSNPEYWNRLFRNNHDGTFSDVTERAGLKGSGYGMGVGVGDFDNDGFTDLLVTTYGGALLYRNNGNGTFTDVTGRAGVRTSGWTTGAAFLDYNNDGCLDLFVSRYLEWNFSIGGMFCGYQKPGGRAYCHPDEFKPVSNYLFRNTCDGRFTDVSEVSHIAGSRGKGLGVAVADFDGDGLPDIYVANDSYPQFLFRNNGDGAFTEVGVRTGVAYNEDGHTFSGMGTAIADIDNDGIPDIVTTALPYEYYALFRGGAGFTFQYESITSGLAQLTRPLGGWGVHIFDFDNDGQKELFLANSHVMDNIEVTQAHLRYAEPPLLLRYSGGKFANISADSGSVFSQPWVARGAAFGDLDNDGDIDAVVSDYDGPVHLLLNQGGNRNHWIALDLQGTKSNRDAIGAKVTLTAGDGKVQYGAVSTAGSYLSANDRRVFFGLGTQTSIKELRIRWPSGTEQVVEQPAADHFLKVVESSSNGPRQTNKAESQSAFREGMEFAKEGKTDRAIHALQNALRLDPDFLEAHFGLGVLLARQGRAQYPAAMNEFVEVLRLNPKDTDAHINLSNLLEQEEDYLASAGEMSKAISLTAPRADLYLMLGRKQQKAGEYPEAAESYRKALKLQPDSVEAHYGAGLALRAMRKPVEAADELKAALAANPQHGDAHYELGRILFADEHFDEAAVHLQHAAQLEPEKADPYLALGKLYRQQGKDEEAERALKAALLRKPDLSPALYELAMLYKQRGDKKQAGVYLQKVRAFHQQEAASGEANAENSKGMSLMNEGNLNDALSAFRRALEMDPAYVVSAYNMGVVLAHQGKQDEAIAAFRQAIGIRPTYAPAHLGLGLLLRMRKDPQADIELQTAAMLKSLNTSNSVRGSGVPDPYKPPDLR
jgi:tetratricopeptide (TPR) repeat protein